MKLQPLCLEDSCCERRQQSRTRLAPLHSQLSPLPAPTVHRVIRPLGPNTQQLQGRASA